MNIARWARDYRRNWMMIEAMSAQQLVDLPQIGENKEAFYYQVNSTGPAPLMRLTFYGSAAVTLGFLPPT